MLKARRVGGGYHHALSWRRQRFGRPCFHKEPFLLSRGARSAPHTHTRRKVMMMRSICTVASTVAVTAALPLTGCSSATEPDEPEPAVRAQALVTEKTAIEAPAELKIKNRTLIRIRKAPSTTAENFSIGQVS
jgi:hypothetical protein